FQQAALDCDRTVLLETSPGHVTRCADTPFVAAFNRARDRLSSRAAAAGEMWAELEQLNLGRLRIASKGLRREGDALVDVPELEQREAGMFMLGQIATARSETTTIAALHEQVTQRATEFLARRADDAGIPTTPEGRPAVTAIRDGSPEPKPLDVAVVGMACVLPQADGLARYWANILAGVDAVTEVP